MFPWTSDDGFAVVDHRKVNPALGTWEDIATLAEGHGMLFDFVANHTSASSPWFLGWLRRDQRYAGYYIGHEPTFDTSKVVRPRTTSLFHDFTRPDGSTVAAWTTFGHDQVDVNAATPAVLLELTDVLLGYLARGRPRSGWTRSASSEGVRHRLSPPAPDAHGNQAVALAVDYVAPGRSYHRDQRATPRTSRTRGRTDEAHMVYQFALPPLVLHAFVTGDTRTWRGGLLESDR